MYKIKKCPKILFWTWTEPDKPSGSPAVLLEILKRIPKGKAWIVCEENCHPDKRKNVDIIHPITRLSAYRDNWPFRRGYKLKQFLKYLSVFRLLIIGFFKILKCRPDCIFTIYFNDLWILSSYLLSVLTRIPVIYYVHDPYLEARQHKTGIALKIAKWLEPKSLRHGYVIVLYESLRSHYKTKYGINSTVVRHIVTRERSTPNSTNLKKNDPVTIGFAGMIYGNNSILMKGLGEVCKHMSSVNLRIFTATDSHLIEEIGLYGDRIKIDYFKNYDELLDSLSKCSLLYLPMAFPDEVSLVLPADSLRYVLPTKAIDYLLAGPPILVHCSEDYELSKFFAKHRAGFLLNTNKPEDLKRWIENWVDNGKEAIDEKNIQKALDTFSARKNLTVLEHVFSSIVKNNNKRLKFEEKNCE